MFKDDIYVIIPTLNEEKSIKNVIEKIPKKIRNKSVSILIIDGNSTDNTVNIAKKCGANVILQESIGKGSAIQEALEKIDAEVVVTIDGDGTYDAEKMNELVEPILDNRADMVVATRLKYREKDSISHFNIIGNKIFSFFVKWLFNKKITDMLSGYRAFNKKKLDNIILLSNKFEIETEITIEAIRNNFRILEIPLFYKKRIGKTKLHPIRDGFLILKTIILLLRDTKPIYFFGMIGIFFLLFSLWPVSLILYEKIIYGKIIHLPSVVLAAFLILLGIQIIILGLLADMNLKNNKRMEIFIKKQLKRGIYENKKA
ncbi:MAG: glycosyltransferase [Candidatus Aenigmatarchaeota archaeon]